MKSHKVLGPLDKNFNGYDLSDPNITSQILWSEIGSTNRVVLSEFCFIYRVNSIINFYVSIRVANFTVGISIRTGLRTEQLKLHSNISYKTLSWICSNQLEWPEPIWPGSDLNSFDVIQAKPSLVSRADQAELADHKTSKTGVEDCARRMSHACAQVAPLSRLVVGPNWPNSSTCTGDV